MSLKNKDAKAKLPGIRYSEICMFYVCLCICFLLASAPVLGASFSRYYVQNLMHSLPEENVLSHAAWDKQDPNDFELLCTTFKSRKFRLLASLLHRGANPLAVCDGTPLVDFIFENLILNYPLETFMPVLEALFAKEDSSKYLTKQSKRTGFLLGQFIPLSSERLRILSFIRFNVKVCLNGLLTLGLDPGPYQSLYHQQKRAVQSSMPFPTFLAWEMFHFTRIIQSIPISQAIEYAKSYDALRDEYFKLKYGNP